MHNYDATLQETIARYKIIVELMINSIETRAKIKNLSGRLPNPKRRMNHLSDTKM